MANVGHLIQDINVYKPSAALAGIMRGPGMESVCQIIADDVVLRYRAKVAKRTGALAMSAQGFAQMGGHGHDRWVAKVTVGGELAVGVWKSVRNPNPGDEFYYGVLHNFGSPLKRGQFPAHDDLKDVMETM